MIALSLGTRGEYRHIGVHTLIAEAFHGPRPTPEHQVAHFDGNPSNNCAWNLRWATAAENAQDRDRHGKTFHPRGILHPNAKLTDEMVRTMRRMKSSGMASVDDLVRMVVRPAAAVTLDQALRLPAMSRAKATSTAWRNS